MPVIFDSDGGVDDAVALWWALGRVDVVAVTAVAGNVAVDQAAVNLATVLHAAGHGEIDVSVGLPAAVGPTPRLRRAAGIHGTDGLGDAGIPRAPVRGPSEPAHETLLRLTAERPGELTIVATGPLSNLARAVSADPGFAGRVGELVIMGGSARMGGNARPAAEANIAHDPAAAAAVVAAGWVRPPLMVGLDVTLQATLDGRLFDLVAEQRTPAASFLAAPIAFYRPLGSTFTPSGECPCHDLLAFMTVARPDMVSGPVLPLEIDTGGSAAWGATVVDFRALAFARRAGATGDSGNDAPDGSPWRIGLEVDVEAFRAEVRTLFGG